MTDPYGYQQPPAPYRMTVEEQAEYDYLSQQLLHERDIDAARRLSSRISELREGGASKVYSPAPRPPAVPQQYAPPAEQPLGFAPQPGAHRAGDLRSERIVVEAPLSFTGSQKRIWRLCTWNSYRQTPLFWLALAPLAIILILLAWSFVLCWYLIFGLWLVPYRMIRRSSRKQKVEAARHAEMMSRLPGPPPQDYRRY